MFDRAFSHEFSKGKKSQLKLYTLNQFIILYSTTLHSDHHTHAIMSLTDNVMVHLAYIHVPAQLTNGCSSRSFASIAAATPW